MTEWHTGRARTTGQRLTVSQAANALGVTPEAIRGRIRRGTMRVEREAGRVYVVLGADQPRPTTDQPTDRTEQLIATLQEQLEAEREANRENRRIIAALTSRIPEIEPPAQEDAPPGARGSPATATGTSEGVQPRSSTGGRQTATVRRSVDELSLLWRYVVGVILSMIVAPFVFILGTILFIVLGEAFIDSFLAYLLFGLMIVGMVGVPAFFGFWLGRKVRSLLFWRHVVPVGALIGLGSGLAWTVAATLHILREAGRLRPTDLMLVLDSYATILVLGGSQSLVYIFAAVFGNAIHRRNREKLAGESPSDSPPGAATAYQGWTPRQQAIVGLAGTIISALIGLIGTILTVLASGGGP